MKTALFSILFLATTICNGQVNLDSKNLTNLVALGELYSSNPDLTGNESAKRIDALRTPQLDRIVDTLIAVSKNDGTILETRYIKRPSNDELLLWYVIREIHYNRTSEKQKPRPSVEVAKEVLGKKIDSRWLLDNYYYRIRGGIASFFNDADLSKYDFKLDGLGLTDNTEKAIFFLNAMDAFAGGRFMVLSMMKNSKRILEFADRLPKFNGQKYYFYRDFEYPDFEWIGYEQTEWYNKRHIDRLYSTLIAHYQAAAELGDKESAQEIRRNSILNEPRYFKFSERNEYLQSLYDSSK